MNVLLLDHPSLDGPTLAGEPARISLSRRLERLEARWVQRTDPAPAGCVLVDGRALALSVEALEVFVAGDEGVLVDGIEGEVLAVRHQQGNHSCEAAFTRADGTSRTIACAGGICTDAWDLSLADRAVQLELLEQHGRQGVRFVDPARVVLDASVQLAPGCVIGPDTTLMGRTTVGPGAAVHQGSWLLDTTVLEDAVIKPGCVCEGATVGAGASVGPMAHLRTGADLGPRVKVGNFVEVKKTRLDAGAKASHLTYLGDAHIGADANIGAGTITCNYDGFRKQQTHIGAGAFIGSNTALVAPIRVGTGAIVGAGSTLTKDVPDDSLAVERADTRTLNGYAPRLNKRNAAAAERAKKHG